MDDQNNVGTSEPVGLDDFLTDMDPQSAMATQGLQAGAQALAQSPIVQNIGPNLDQYKRTLDAAIAGDPNSQLTMANNALGASMGSIQIAGPRAAPIFTTEEAGAANYAPGAIQKLQQKLGSTSMTGEQMMNAPGLTQQEMRMAAQKANRPKPYAEGGEVEPAGLDQFIGGSESQPMVDNQAPSQTGEPEGLNDFLYGSGTDQAKAFLEGAGRGATFGLSTGLETAAGVDPEAIRGRQEANPITSVSGEMTGLAGSALIPGVGEANLLSKAGEGAVAAAGLTGAEALAPKIGSKAIQMAAETALYQTGDEVSKMLSQDPNQTAQTALVDIGLAGVLGAGGGAAFGAISPLWKAADGAKTGGILKFLSDRLGGIEGSIPSAVDDAIQASGMDVSPEIRSALSNDPAIQHMFQTLQESSTGPGLKAQEALSNFKSQAADQLAATLGKTPEDVATMATSDYETGEELKKSLVDNLKAQVDPISKDFEKVKNKYSRLELNSDDQRQIADSVLKMSTEHGYDLSPSAPQAKLINQVLSELPNLKTAESLRKYSSVLTEQTSNPDMWRVGGQIKKILRDAEDQVVTNGLHIEAPELLDTHANARQSYKAVMDNMDQLNERLHVGKYSGPDSFIKALKDMAPEDVVKRLAQKNDVGLLKHLSDNYPKVAEAIKDYHINTMLSNAADKAGADEVLNPKVLFNQIDKMSPELRSFVLPDQAMGRLNAIQGLLEQLPKRINPSGTAKAMDSLMGHLPASAGAMIDLLKTGHFGAGAIIGALGKALGRDVPDAIRYSMLKFLGSSKPVEAEGFKSMLDFVHATMRGEATLSRAAKNIFKSGSEVLPESFMPTEKDRMKLDKHLSLVASNPQPLMALGGKSGHYLPEAAAAMSTAAMAAVTLLNQAKPQENKSLPLDSKPTISATQRSSYNAILNVAQQPLLILSQVKDGTITPESINAVKTMYPALYQRMSGKLMQEMTDAMAKDKMVPYKTRIGLSMFLGTPVDSTFNSSAIMAAQPKPDQTPQPQQPGGSPKRSTSSLSKLPGQYETPTQALQKRMQKE